MALPTLHQFQTLLAVIDEGGFESAARHLQVSAPAVSQRIRALEAGLGRVVLHRTTPPELTQAGRVLLPYARCVVRLAAEAVDAASGRGTQARASLPLAVNADSLSTWFLDALAVWPGRAGVDIDLERVDQDLAAAALASGRVLGAVTTNPVPVRGCTSERLGVMRYLPVASPDFIERYDLRPGRPAVAERLATAPVVDYDADDALQRGFLADWLGRPVEPPRHRIPDTHGFTRAIEAGLGWGLVGEEQGRAGLAAGRLLRLSASRHHDVVLHWQRWDLPTRALDEFGRHLVGFARARLRG